MMYKCSVVACEVTT